MISVALRVVVLVSCMPLLVGCVETVASTGSNASSAPRNSTAGTWQMPWQISPASILARANEPETILAYVPETGFVRATPNTMAGVGHPLIAQNGPNVTVEPCRDVVVSEATKLGARSVEAVSGGTQTRDKGGNFIAPVLIRVTYASLGGYEVREATLTCVVARSGKIVDAFAQPRS